MREKRYAKFEILFKTYQVRLYFYALNMINNKAGAEDIVEDVFCYLWENQDVLIEDISPLPLLYSLVRNRCIDYFRHRNVKERFQESVALQSEWHETQENETEHHERITKIMEAIEALPPQTRKVFEACFLHGKKYKEVGMELEISINTVKTHITRALTHIRKRVGQPSEKRAMQ